MIFTSPGNKDAFAFKSKQANMKLVSCHSKLKIVVRAGAVLAKLTINTKYYLSTEYTTGFPRRIDRQAYIPQTWGTRGEATRSKERRGKIQTPFGLFTFRFPNFHLLLGILFFRFEVSQPRDPKLLSRSAST